MPEFFVPDVQDAEGAEEVWQATKAFQDGAGSPLTDRRIFRLGYMHNGEHMEAEVGW